MAEKNALSTARAWQDAVNRRDIDRVLELSDPEIEIAGPRGSGQGHQLLRDWLAHARLRLETLRTFEREENVVMAQHGIWRSMETGEVIGEGDVASRFRIGNGRVAEIARYDKLDEALREAGLGDEDEVLSER